MKYVKDGKLINKLPRTHKLKNGRTVSGFNHWEQSDSDAVIAEGFLPVTIINNEDYDPEIQTRTDPVITENADHATLDYVVADKPLAEVKQVKKEKIKLEGRQIFKAKWDLEYRIMGMYTPEEEFQMDTDRDKLLAYYKTEIEPMIDNAVDVIEVKNIIYIWPAWEKEI